VTYFGLVWPWYLTSWTSNLIISCHRPLTTFANLHWNQFIRFKNIIFINLVTDEQTEERITYLCQPLWPGRGIKISRINVRVLTIMSGVRCLGSRLPTCTWQMTVASSRTAHVALCGQPMSRRAWYHEPTAAMATEPLQLLDLGCGTHYQSSCAIQTLATDGSDDSRGGYLFRNDERGALWSSICSAIEKRFTCLLTF